MKTLSLLAESEIHLSYVAQSKATVDLGTVEQPDGIVFKHPNQKGEFWRFYRNIWRSG